MIFNQDGNYDVFSYPGEDMTEWFGSSVLKAGGHNEFAGGFPLNDDIIGVGIGVSGTDEDAHELEFHAFLELNHVLPDQ